MVQVKDMQFIDPEKDNTGIKKMKCESYGGMSYINVFGLGNCQTFSIAWMDNIINKFAYSDAELKKALAMCGKQAGQSKPMCLVDVKNQYADIIRRLYKDRIRIDAPYVSTNGSHMNLILFKIDYSVL